MNKEEIEIIKKALYTEETHEEYLKNITEAHLILNKEKNIIDLKSMKLNKRLIAYIILFLYLILFLVSIWIFVGKELVYFF